MSKAQKAHLESSDSWSTPTHSKNLRSNKSIDRLSNSKTVSLHKVSGRKLLQFRTFN